MKRLGTIAASLTAGLVLNASLRAADPALSGNPYAVIVARNIFGLNPPPPPGANDHKPDPPVKITPNGIMDLFGQLQVLFKTAGSPRPGQPAKDNFYTLAEGEAQDDIEVVHIDQKAGMITFNNHGIVQELPLANAPATTTPAPARGGFGPGGRFPLPGGPDRVPPRFGGRFGGVSGGMHGVGVAPNGTGMGNNNYNNPAASFAGSGGGYTGQPTGQQQQPLTAEEATVLIEANRLATAQQVQEGKLPPLPPTAATPSGATGFKGNPLVSMPTPP